MRLWQWSAESVKAFGQAALYTPGRMNIPDGLDAVLLTELERLVPSLCHYWIALMFAPERKQRVLTLHVLAEHVLLEETLDGSAQRYAVKIPLTRELLIHVMDLPPTDAARGSDTPTPETDR